MRVYCATSNRGKLREFSLAGAVHGVEVEPVPGLESIPAPHETGNTFEENAILKAEYYSRFVDGLVFADDSGLEVDALGGEPGVNSARYAGEGATDEANNQLLIAKLQGVKNRSARFVCWIALARGGQVIETFRGAVEGRIVDTPQGSNGFGYDPHFFYEPFGCTFGQAGPERKMTVSHRGQALRAMFAKLSRIPD